MRFSKLVASLSCPVFVYSVMDKYTNTRDRQIQKYTNAKDIQGERQMQKYTNTKYNIQEDLIPNILKVGCKFGQLRSGEA